MTHTDTPRETAHRREPDDAALIERSLREPDRFADVFDRHFAEIHGFLARRLGPSLADDLAAETFLIAFDRCRATRAHARRALLASTSRRRRRPRLAFVAAAAAAVALAAALAPSVGDNARTVPTASAAMVLERAAVAAEHRAFTAPRPDQWFYFEDRVAAPEDHFTIESWRRADGGATASISPRTGGRLQIERTELPRHRIPPEFGPLASYEAVAKLPRDPDALLRWAYGLAKNITGAGIKDNGDVYAIFNGMLRDNLMAPELEAAIFRALKQVPGVSVTKLDVGGRPALAVTQTEDFLEEELLLDARTYAYLGERSTVVKDTVVSPEKAGNASGRIDKGHTVVVERVAAGIVDAAGARR